MIPRTLVGMQIGACVQLEAIRQVAAAQSARCFDPPGRETTIIDDEDLEGEGNGRPTTHAQNH